MGLQRLFLAVIQMAGLYGRTKTNPFQITKELWRRLSTQQPNIADRIWQIELRHDIILPWEPKLEVGGACGAPGSEPRHGGNRDHRCEEGADLQSGQSSEGCGGMRRPLPMMKRLCPGWMYVSVADDRIGGFNTLEGADKR